MKGDLCKESQISQREGFVSGAKSRISLVFVSCNPPFFLFYFVGNHNFGEVAYL